MARTAAASNAEQTLPPGRARLAGRVAIVCGAGSSAPGLSIGMACATLFAREGATVFGVDQVAAHLEHTRERIATFGGRFVDHLADVSDPVATQRMAQACVSECGGRIDVLVNVVGVNAVGGPGDIDEAAFDAVLRTNLRSMWATCRAVLPTMRAQREGAIVNISSLAALRYSYPSVAYAASKGGVNALTRQLAGQFAAEGVRCNVVLPGYIASAGNLARLRREAGDDGAAALARRAQAVPCRRVGEPWDVAHAALYLAGDEAGYVNGIELVVDGGLSIAMPAG